MKIAPLTVACRFSPADQDNYQQLLGALDYSFLCAYAIGMYLRWVCFVCEPLASAGHSARKAPGLWVGAHLQSLLRGGINASPRVVLVCAGGTAAAKQRSYTTRVGR